MSLLSPTTIRRLASLPKDQGVWEGDRRPLPAIFKGRGDSESGKVATEWVLWVDDEKVIRAMDIIPMSAGPEVLVRTLIKAIEYPQGPASPVCPRRIYVRDREDQFFLRGALQELEIEVNYSAQLPLTNEIVQSMEVMSSTYGSALSPTFQTALDQIADRVWQRAPWHELADHHVIEITLTPVDKKDSETYYLCCLGQMGLEFGLLLYRSLKSLQEFRQSAIAHHDEPDEDLESIFLSQDCIFLNYELDAPLLPNQPLTFASINVGTIHPLEGLRPFLEEEEAMTLMVGLEGFLRFHQRYRQRFVQEDFPDIKGNYSVRPLLENPDQNTTKVAVKSLPDISLELLELGAEMAEADLLDSDKNLNPEDLLDFLAPQFTLDNDLIPDQSLVSIGVMPWDLFEMVSHKVNDLDLTPVGDGLPIVMVQTSRPKAKKIQGLLEDSGGLVSIGFLKGIDDGSDQGFDIGVLSTQDGVFHIFGEYEDNDPVHMRARKKWEGRVQTTQGHCALVITSGVTGVARGNPRPRDIMAILGAKNLSEGFLGVHPLQLRTHV